MTDPCTRPPGPGRSRTPLGRYLLLCGFGALTASTAQAQDPLAVQPSTWLGIGPEIGIWLALLCVVLLALSVWRVSWRNHRLNDELRRDRVAHRDLAESEALYRLLTESAGDVIWMIDLATDRVEYISPSVERVRGFTPEEVKAQPMEASLTPQSAVKVQRLIAESVARIRGGDMEACHVTTEIEQPCKDGRTIRSEVVTSFLLDEQGEPARILGITRDVSERKALEAELRTRLAAVEAAGDAIVITDTDGHVLYANPVFTAQTGYDLEVDGHMHTRQLKSGQHDDDFYDALWGTVLAGELWRGEIINRRKNGELYEEEMTISPVKNEDGEIQCFVAVKRDVSEKRAMERALKAANEQLQANLDRISRLQAELAEQAIRDPLTGLHNRRYLNETLPRELARAKHESYRLTAAMIDIDHFKQINDTWGHPAGDEVIRALAKLLQERFREGDILCRFGGEEFLLVMPHIAQQVGLSRVESMRREFADRSIQTSAGEIRATVSIGIASYPVEAQTPESLINQADAALYDAKHLGRNRTELSSGGAASAVDKGPSIPRV
nr:sensor domain-containing diguanylate cyclase [Thiorhodococcus minor]